MRLEEGSGRELSCIETALGTGTPQAVKVIKGTPRLGIAPSDQQETDMESAAWISIASICAVGVQSFEVWQPFENSLMRSPPLGLCFFIPFWTTDKPHI